ncbi:hypothetical protein ACHAXT_008279 [Thalassiosira profunda]
MGSSTPPTMGGRRRRTLWTALLLACGGDAAAASSDRGGRLRKRPPRHTRVAHPSRPRHPHPPETPTRRRLATECTADEQPFVLTFQTDNYGEETSWFLRQIDPASNTVLEEIGSGPSAGNQYGEFTLYSFHYCLGIGSTYTLAMEDNFGDGMCCARGHGGYEYTLGGKLIYSTYLRHTFRDYVEHTFTIEGQYLSPAPTPANEPTKEMACASDPTECGCDDVEQEDYRGTLSETEGGYSCLAWATAPGSYTPVNYPDDDLQENYCRSAGGGWPWCYISEGEGWEYCRVPSCPEVEKGTGPTKSPAVATPAPIMPDAPTESPSTPPTISPSLEPTKSPTPFPTLPPTPYPTPPPNVQNSATGCFGADVQFKLELRTDFFASDASWALIDQSTQTVVASQPNGTYTERDTYNVIETCIPQGNYTFIVKDEYGDGWCCRYGEGMFRVHLDGKETLNGGSFNANMTATLHVGFRPEGYMTQRETDYLVAHNVRRKDWHERYNLTYVPLQYSPELAKQSQAWAEELLNTCGVVGIEHEDYVYFGENLAKNTGNPETWGQLYPADNIVRRWVDFEIGLLYPSNGHLTQCLWRASKYVGCGESVKDFRKGVCRIQVCRYARAGNCSKSVSSKSTISTTITATSSGSHSIGRKSPVPPAHKRGGSVFSGLPSPTKQQAPKSVQERRSPNDDVTARTDRSGAFPQGQQSAGVLQSPIPPSPRRGFSHPPNIPQSPIQAYNPKQPVSLTPRMASSGASVGSNGGRSTPTRGLFGRRRTNGEEEKKAADCDDNATHASYHSQHSHGSGNQGSGRFGDGRSVASAGSGPRYAASVSGSTHSSGIPLSLHDSVKQKGLAKRKRKEIAKDPRYAHVRRTIDELNKAIGPEKRRAAVDRACLEFDHDNAALHNAELYLGAANVLCLVLSMSDDADEVRNICRALEMVYRAEREAVVISYQDVGAALVPLLLRLLERCEKGRKAMGSEATIGAISKILLHMTRISELRVPLVGHPGMLAALERVATLPLSTENRVLRMRLLANVANAEGNKATVFARGPLMEATMKVATLDKAEGAREYASAVLMDLSSCPANQVAMARMDKVLATLVKLAVVEDKTETREYAVSGLQNLAFEKRNRMQLVSYGGGVVVEALKKCTAADTNDKTRRRAAGALTNLACDETAEKMANHAGLLEALARASMSDENRDVQQRATLALTKLANSITVKMGCWDALLDALIQASQCSVADGIVSAMFRVKTRTEENRSSMANHPRLLQTLSQLCLRTQDAEDQDAAHKDCENATKALAHLANDPRNHRTICTKDVLAALVHGASIEGPQGAVTRDAALLAMERMAMEHGNRPMMARYPGVLTSVARAAERELHEEVHGRPASAGTGQPRLAKPLLMSLLVAM